MKLSSIVLFIVFVALKRCEGVTPSSTAHLKSEENIFMTPHCSQSFPRSLFFLLIAFPFIPIAYFLFDCAETKTTHFFSFDVLSVKCGRKAKQTKRFGDEDFIKKKRNGNAAMKKWKAIIKKKVYIYIRSSIIKECNNHKTKKKGGKKKQIIYIYIMYMCLSWIPFPCAVFFSFFRHTAHKKKNF